MNLKAVLESLARKRPIFHNEADFQHALAWELREKYDCKIRLEKRIDIDPQKRSYLDIWVEHNDRRIAIELKYKMRAVEYIHEGETFTLLNQGAQDIGRYDVIKDLQRLEQMVKYQIVDEGHLIFLTNDLSYHCNPGMEKSTADRDFRVHEGRVISGSLAWHESTGAGTMKGREEPIFLEGKYKLSWQEYSQLDTSGGEIKALAVSVTPYQFEVPKVRRANVEVQNKAVQTITMPKVDRSITGLSEIVCSINDIPVSQTDLRDKLAAQLVIDGYKVETNRDLGFDKIDIWAVNGTEQLAIEVRFKTALLQTMYGDKVVDLKNQAAQDISRYDYLKDLEKLERVVSKRPGIKGYAILITNDHNYWTQSTRVTSVDEAFRIHQGKVVHGQLQWMNASSGTMENRHKPISIHGSYTVNWSPYLVLGVGKNEVFQILIVEVGL